MKRQIKFRVLDIEKKCFIPDYAWALLVNNQAFGVMMIDWENYREGEYFYDNAQILMQFTGRKDIKGKDIYEGDIVNIYSGFGYFKNEEGVNVTYIVNFKACEYLLYRPDIKLTWGRLSRLEEMNYNCEIIGNIYENPELLKTTENE